MYPDDSFHTLTLPGQLGLVCVSLALSAILLFIAWRAMARRGPMARAGIAVILFYLFVWLSPQAYYAYYLTVFDGLIWQNVIKRPPTLWSLFDILGFQGHMSLSAHSKGLLGWALIAMAFVAPRFRQDNG